MSYFIANTINFSKDFKTFKVKGGDNNVIPRFNEWSRDIPIECLYHELNGGMIQIRSTKDKELIVKQTTREMEYGGTWEEENDYYHAYAVFNRYKTKEELEEKVKAMEASGEKWNIVRAKGYKTFIENWEEEKKKFDNFNKEYLKELEKNLKNKIKGEYIVKTKHYGYIAKKLKNKFYTTHYEDKAEKYSYYRAKEIAEDLNERYNTELIKLNK